MPELIRKIAVEPIVAHFKFFEDEKKEMPKLPNKSISFCIALFAAIFANFYLRGKYSMFMNAAVFAPFVEEIVFRKTVKDVFKNVYLQFILFSIQSSEKFS